MIADYTKLVTALGSGARVRDWEEQVGRLETERASLVARSREIEEYLDWWQANHSEVQSGEFDRYLEAAERLEGEQAPREDPVSRYLDQLGREFR